MAGNSVPYIFTAGTSALATEVNANFAYIVTTNDQLTGTPRSAAFDMNGEELILDLDGDSSITANTDDRIDFRLSATDLFGMDGTVATPVNGYDFIASATTVAPQLTAVGSDTDISINIVPKGAGDLQVNGGSMSPLAWQVYGA